MMVKVLLDKSKVVKSNVVLFEASYIFLFIY